jgi:hypothetical protein
MDAMRHAPMMSPSSIAWHAACLIQRLGLAGHKLQVYVDMVVPAASRSTVMATCTLGRFDGSATVC